MPDKSNFDVQSFDDEIDGIGAFIHEIQRPLYNFRMAIANVNSPSASRRKGAMTKSRNAADEMRTIIAKYNMLLNEK